MSGRLAVGELQPHELGVDAILGDEAAVGAALDEDALVHDPDLVGARTGWRTDKGLY